MAEKCSISRQELVWSDSVGSRKRSGKPSSLLLNTGHCHPKVSTAAADQCMTLVHGQCSIAAHPKYLELIERISPHLPDSSLDTFFWWNSGTHLSAHLIYGFCLFTCVQDLKLLRRPSRWQELQQESKESSACKVHTTVALTVRCPLRRARQYTLKALALSWWAAFSIPST